MIEYVHNGILLSNKKEQNNSTGNSTGESQKHAKIKWLNTKMTYMSEFL
jgi:hypothetical protein